MSMSEESQESGGTIPSQSVNWGACLICHKKDKGELTKFTDRSWATFKTCSEARNDELFQQIGAQWGKGPLGYYHRKPCYSNYTNKKYLKRKSDGNASADASQKEVKKPRLSRSLIGSSLFETCIICQKPFKPDKSDRRKSEPLMDCQTFEAGKTLRTAAEIREDERIRVALIGDTDVIAAEVKYHFTCYRDYTRPNTLDSMQQKRIQIQDETYCGYDKAFTKLAASIQTRIVDGTEVLSMQYLREQYVELLSTEGVDAPNYRTEKLKNRILKHFQANVAFWHPKYRSQSELVYSNLVPKGQIVEMGISSDVHGDVEYEYDSNEFDSESSDLRNVYNCAKYIRRSLLDHDRSVSGPPTPDDLTEDRVSLPDQLYNLLAWIFTDERDIPVSGRVYTKSHMNKIILSVGQDILYSASRGRTRTPKHVSLAMTVKSLTGSASVITLLNKFGHCISYTMLEMIETAMAERQMARAREQHMSLLPSNIQPGSFATWIWDNNDILEETLSGGGTTHCTNGIVVQRKVATCAPPPVQTAETNVRLIKRSFKPEADILLPYVAGKRSNPPTFMVNPESLKGSDTVYMEPLRCNFGWFLCRLGDLRSTININVNEQKVPGWSAFNAKVSQDSIPNPSSIGYCQVIDASPTQLPVVYNVLKRSVNMADQHDQEDVVIVFDQAIYAKALEIIWKNPVEFKRIVPCMGAFHIACTFLAVIGKRFGDAGLRDVIIESEILGSGSVVGMLEGRHYNRGIRVHKIVFEAMLRLRWKAFRTWLTEQNIPGLNDIGLQEVVNTLQADITPDNFRRLIDSNDFGRVYDLYLDYCNTLTTPMAIFWNSYINMVSLLLHLIRSTRVGNWQLHVACIRDLIPWLFAYDRTNYSRYLPVYWCEVELLSQTHPQAYNSLSQGEFAIQRGTHAFAQVPRDQAIEQTLNRDTKTSGGIVGFSLNKGAVQRWLVTAHERAAIKENCFSMAGIKGLTEQANHKEATRSRINQDYNAVDKVVNVLQSFNNPYSESDEICSLTSGTLADEAIKNDLMGAYDKGQAAAISFVQSRLQSNETSFYGTLSKMNLKTFSNLNKTKSLKVGNKEVILKADRGLFVRIILIAQKRSLDLRTVLKHSLGPIPWPLAYVDGTICKTGKDKLSDVLEKGVAPAENVPRDSVWIIDLMAYLNALIEPPSTFSDLAALVLTKSFRFSQAENARIDIVSDQYPAVSIKYLERGKRAKGGTIKVKISGGNQKVPKQWKKFLADGDNKTCLMEFLFQEWEKPAYANHIASHCLYFAHGKYCHRYASAGETVTCEPVPELDSTQEEADTRLLLHAKHAADAGNTNIVISSVDTDVEVLACFCQAHINGNLFLHTGTSARSRFVNINAVARKVGLSVCKALPGLHAFTGSDTTSAFSGKGKKKAFDLVVSELAHCEAMQKIGESLQMDDEVLQGSAKFVCALYAKQGSDVDEARYQCFCNEKAQSHLLPPCQDALWKHAKRANYQAFIWHSTLNAKPGIPGPDGHGWIVKNGIISIDWMDLPPAPKAVLELIKCGCSGDCSGNRCSCFGNRLPCTDCCGCGVNCVNSEPAATGENSDSDSEVDSDNE